MRLSGKHIYDYVQKNMSLYYTHAPLCFKAGENGDRDFFEDFKQALLRQPAGLSYKGKKIPFFYYSSADDFTSYATVSFETLICNAFILLSGFQELVFTETDEHERFLYSSSLQRKHGFALLPVVNYYFKIIQDKHNAQHMAGEAVLAKTFKAPGNIVFSHDIDRLYSGSVEALGYVVKKAKFRKVWPLMRLWYRKALLGKDDYYDVMYEILGIEKENGIQAHYFFMANRGPMDSDYSVSSEQVKKMIAEVKKVGHRIGIHPGYDTYNNPENFAKQKAALEAALGETVHSSRQHFLKFHIRHTTSLLRQLSVEKDYSLGFAEQSGFRNSFCAPFYLYDFNENSSSDILETPLYFMDSTLIKYNKGLNKQESLDLLMQNLSALKEEFYVNVSVLFHNTVFTDYKYAGFKAMYLKVAQWCDRNRFSKEAV